MPNRAYEKKPFKLLKEVLKKCISCLLNAICVYTHDVCIHCFSKLPKIVLKRLHVDIGESHEPGIMPVIQKTKFQFDLFTQAIGQFVTSNLILRFWLD